MEVLVVVVVTALVFDFTNGFHATANAMATSIATGALPPRVAVAVSAVLNLVGAFLSIEVAQTVVAVIGVIVGAAAWILSRRNPVGAHNVAVH